jgi:hypothetical protein
MGVIWMSKIRTNTQFVTVPAASTFTSFGVTTFSPLFTAVRAALPEGAYIAGGYLTSLLAKIPVRDIDIWFRDEAAYTETRTRILGLTSLGLHEKASPRLAGTTFVGLAGEVSLNAFDYFSSPEETLDCFDFTVAQLALVGPNLLVGPTTLADIRAKELVLHREEFTILNRAEKYIKKGFTPGEKSWERFSQLAGPLTLQLTTLRRTLARTGPVPNPHQNDVAPQGNNE